MLSIRHRLARILISCIICFNSIEKGKLAREGKGNDTCESDLLMIEVGPASEWIVEPLTKYVQGKTAWNIQLNDSEPGIFKHDVKCHLDCQHCNVESLRPKLPQVIDIGSRNGTNVCVKWKEDASTIYTMFYKPYADYFITDFQDYNKRCTAVQKLTDNEVECCPDDLPLTGNMGVRIDYWNEYMYVYGIKFVLRDLSLDNTPPSLTSEQANALDIVSQELELLSCQELEKRVYNTIKPPIQLSDEQMYELIKDYRAYFNDDNGGEATETVQCNPKKRSAQVNVCSSSIVKTKFQMALDNNGVQTFVPQLERYKLQQEFPENLCTGNKCMSKLACKCKNQTTHTGRAVVSYMKKTKLKFTVIDIKLRSCVGYI